MLKGYQRKLVMVRTKNSKIFESAFFILRSSAAVTHADMVDEANRILNECGEPRRRIKPHVRHILTAAGISFLLGAAIVGAVWMAVWL